MRISGAIVDGFTNGLREIEELREGYLHRELEEVRLQGGGAAAACLAELCGGESRATGNGLMWGSLEKKEEEKSFKKFHYGMV